MNNDDYKRYLDAVGHYFYNGCYEHEEFDEEIAKSLGIPWVNRVTVFTDYSDYVEQWTADNVSPDLMEKTVSEWKAEINSPDGEMQSFGAYVYENGFGLENEFMGFDAFLEEYAAARAKEPKSVDFSGGVHGWNIWINDSAALFFGDITENLETADVEGVVDLVIEAWQDEYAENKYPFPLNDEEIATLKAQMQERLSAYYGKDEQAQER